jgi:hypothetical protein
MDLIGLSEYSSIISKIFFQRAKCKLYRNFRGIETELTKNGVSGTKMDQTKSIIKIGNIVVFPVCAVNIPKMGQSPLGKLIVTNF